MASETEMLPAVCGNQLTFNNVEFQLLQLLSDVGHDFLLQSVHVSLAQAVEF